MIFGQLSNRESLRDLVLMINAHQNKAYHLGFGKGVSRSILAKANEQRSWKIYRDFTDHIISEAKKLNLGSNESAFSFSNPIYAVGSTTIDLCLSVFWWADYKTTKAAIKVHTQLDIRTSIPEFALISESAVHDVAWIH